MFCWFWTTSSRCSPRAGSSRNCSTRPAACGSWLPAAHRCTCPGSRSSRPAARRCRRRAGNDRGGGRRVRVGAAVRRTRRRLGARLHRGRRERRGGRGNRGSPGRAAAGHRAGGRAGEAAAADGNSGAVGATRWACWSAAAGTCRPASGRCAATIAWSYELLSDSARQLLAACSVFRGGIALDDHRERLRRGGRPSHTRAGRRGRTGRSQPAPAGGSGAGGRPAVRDAGTGPRVRGRAAGRAAGVRAGPSGARGGVRGPGRGSGPSAALAGQGRPGPARARARQLPGRAGLLPAGGSGRRAAAGQPAHGLLVRARPFLGGTAAPGRPARPGPRRRHRADGRPERRRVARGRSG